MKEYQKPTIQIVPIRHSGIICLSGTEVKGVSSADTGITYGGGNNGAARVKERSVWDDEW